MKYLLFCLTIFLSSNSIACKQFTGNWKCPNGSLQMTLEQTAIGWVLKDLIKGQVYTLDGISRLYDIENKYSYTGLCQDTSIAILDSGAFGTATFTMTLQNSKSFEIEQEIFGRKAKGICFKN
jgi:hypothetical protein